MFLNKKKEGSILEVGCGWGGFAEVATDEGDYSVKGITLSTEQQDYAKNRLVNKNADIVIEDYRIQQGQYDYIVSIEMIEAVGKAYWNTYFSKLKSLLTIAQANFFCSDLTRCTSDAGINLRIQGEKTGELESRKRNRQ
jgi:cyclopropane fatty-acyl-phospholipid synthase-like methyltransferase